MNDPDPRHPSTTEEAAATPGWVETELDGIMASLPQRPAIAALRRGYLDCLAGIGGGDIDAAHDRCRAMLLAGLEGDGVAAGERAALDRLLAGLEAEISART